MINFTIYELERIAENLKSVVSLFVNKTENKEELIAWLENHINDTIIESIQRIYEKSIGREVALESQVRQIIIGLKNANRIEERADAKANLRKSISAQSPPGGS